MKVTQMWKRNNPSTGCGESITLTTVYSSFDKNEIDELEKMMPKGIMITGYEPGPKKSESQDKQASL